MPHRWSSYNLQFRRAIDEAAAAVRWSRAAVLAAWVVPALLFAVACAVSYRSTFAEADERLERAARIGQEHAARVFETNEVIARSVLQEAGDLPDERLRAAEADLHRLMVGLTRGLGQFQSVWLWDVEGRPLASSRFASPPRTLGVADREYFAWARDNAGDAWFVSRPLISRSTGEPFIDFTRRRSMADGRFGGVVSVSLFPAYFTKFYEDLTRREPGLTVALVRRDGWLLARWPEPPALDTRLGPDSELLARMEEGLRAGTSEGRSSIDGRDRKVAFRQVADLPVWVAASLPRDVVLAAWQRQVALLGAFVLPLAVWLAVTSSTAARRAVREQAALDGFRTEAEHRVRAEEALRQGQKLEALGRITGNVAHDFNNLLMVISNNVFLLRRIGDAASAQPRLDAIRRAVSAGTKLTRQLLSFARRQPLQPAPLPMAATMAEIAGLVRTVVGSSVTVESEVAPDVAAIEVDRDEFELAVLNLAVNARDAMPAGGTVRLSARRVVAPEGLPDGGGPFVAVAIADTGQGIPPDVLDRVFEPFFTTKPAGQGTGLGLAQVYGFATQSGGTVQVSSEPGRGTVVTMYLPEAGAAPERPAEAGPVPPPSVRATVMLVEDNPEVADTTRRLLEDAGCVVESAADGERALERVTAEPERWDVVLSDVMMPGPVDGLALARALRERLPELPVVLMTGHAPQLESALADGFEVLPKPCSPSDLVRAISRSVGRRRATS
ncbi:MAG TPA: ATP-binding protein [Burkholderiaceae bacterium]|nr:ATP-binding protein [Burkholderiaceae bacterium]